jgi:hypothetical protein
VELEQQVQMPTAAAVVEQESLEMVLMLQVLLEVTAVLAAAAVAAAVALVDQEFYIYFIKEK